MEIFLFLAIYIVYLIFWGRLFLHGLLWFRASGNYYWTTPGTVPLCSFSVCVPTLFDIIFFRRLWEDNKLLWFGSWTFHVSFLVVIIRHLRYFMDPVPDCVVFVQPFGVVAGYLLPLSVAYIVLIRTLGLRTKYVSYQNYFILGLVFAISALGLLMRNFFVPDLPEVKEFALGILRFGPWKVPGSLLFFAHFLLVLVLVPYLPFHIFTAPYVMGEARRREAGLKMVMHDR